MFWALHLGGTNRSQIVLELSQALEIQLMEPVHGKVVSFVDVFRFL